MAILAVSMFTGITYLAHAYQVVPSETETVVSQIARGVFGGRNVMYYVVQGATMLILVLAAYTALRTSRGWPQSSRATASCRASS